ncbi:MAG: VWA domain-containing protein, partial [Verrucomicrobia bacterium]|nr:VWA domain-containing protein [Verrucomicrobiota bacterium]
MKAMNKANSMLARAIMAAAAFLPAALMADSISPTSVSGTVNVGGSITVNKTVTVTAGTPTTSKVDVYFLADTTGSMGTTIASVKASAASILSSTAGLGDVAFGVGEYKDVGDVYTWRQNVAGTHLTTTQATAQTAINLWGASGGGDTPEAQLFAMDALSTDTGWRTGSTRILVWFGDAPGHDPSSGVTEASATASLVAKGIKVEAIDVGAMNSTGQALRIATATGGSFQAGINSASIVAAITAAITSSFDTYSTVGLDLSDVPAGVTVTALPASYSGSYDRSIQRTFGFTVKFTGDAVGTYDFPIYGT